MLPLLALLALAAPATAAPDGRCDDSDAFSARTLRGNLHSAERACLEKRLERARSREEGEWAWRLLLADAMARGRQRRWRELVQERHAWRLQRESDDLACADATATGAARRACAIRAKARVLRNRVGPGAFTPDPLATLDPATCPPADDLLSRVDGGTLSPEELRCLFVRLEDEAPPDLAVAFLQFLLADTQARGGVGASYALLRTAFGGLDCIRPEVWLANEAACDLMDAMLDQIEDAE